MYPATVRSAWVDFIDAQHRAGNITDKVADNATLIPGKYILLRENAPGYPYRIKRVREYQPGE